MLQGGGVVCPSSFFGGGERSKMLQPSFYLNAGEESPSQFSVFLLWMNSLITGFIGFGSLLIPAVLLIRASSKIDLLIIQSVAVNVIDSISFWNRYQNPMHGNKSLFSYSNPFCSASIERPFPLICKPFKLIEILKIFIINHTELVLSKYDSLHTLDFSTGGHRYAS